MTISTPLSGPSVTSPTALLHRNQTAVDLRRSRDARTGERSRLTGLTARVRQWPRPTSAPGRSTAASDGIPAVVSHESPQSFLAICCRTVDRCCNVACILFTLYRSKHVLHLSSVTSRHVTKVGPKRHKLGTTQYSTYLHHPTLKSAVSLPASNHFQNLINWNLPTRKISQN